MQDPFAQMMAQQPTAPTVQQPGGGMGPQDQTVYGSAVVVQALKQLSEQWRMQGDEDGAIVCDKAALDINRHRVKKQREMQQRMEAVQSTILPPML